MIEPEIKLTKYSHGAGCGCKISPKILKELIESNGASRNPLLLVGNHTCDDAAVYDIGNGLAVISTTDFFMPIVDDPHDFGAIAAANALSDVYAMGGKPLMAIAILGWPVDKIDTAIAARVLEGGRSACLTAGIEIAGGHSIDNPEPVFGLAVTGMVETNNLKRNDTAIPGSTLYLTKPLGVGLITTAQKKGVVKNDDLKAARDVMITLNAAGHDFGKLSYVNAMTDVTGFGLLGHLTEMCEGSKVSAVIVTGDIPRLDNTDYYIENKTVPGGTGRNWESYGARIESIPDDVIALLADPQTSGGLLVSVNPGKENDFETAAKVLELNLKPIGNLIEQKDKLIYVN